MRKWRFTGQWWFAKHWRLGEIIHLASVLLYRESYKSCNHHQTAQPVPLLFFHPLHCWMNFSHKVELSIRCVFIWTRRINGTYVASQANMCCWNSLYTLYDRVQEFYVFLEENHPGKMEEPYELTKRDSSFKNDHSVIIDSPPFNSKPV